MFGITKKKKPSLIMSGLLGILYLYIFVLIQLETFALLAGSLGLFIILAMVMYFSKKIDWFMNKPLGEIHILIQKENQTMMIASFLSILLQGETKAKINYGA